MLKDLAGSRVESPVGCAIAKGLAIGWREHSETLPWLKHQVQFNENSSITIGAVAALSSCRNDPEVLQVIIERLQRADTVESHGMCSELVS